MLPPDGELARQRIEAAAALAETLVRRYAQLARINRAIRRWEAWEANAALPPDLRREFRTPMMTHASLVSLCETELDVIAALEAGKP
jgi:hypothetical protein